MPNTVSSTDRADTNASTALSITRLERADQIITSHVLMSVGAGLIPVAGFDLAAGLTIQLTLLKRLSTLYGVSYSQNLGKGIVMSFLSTIGGFETGQTVALSLIKFIPFVGTAVGTLSMSAVVGAFTYALGKVFTQHLESGGTFLDFEPTAYRDSFRQMFKRGKTVVKDVDSAEPNAPAPATV
jgi:uncharacterized protein (DUF697 family)